MKRALSCALVGSLLGLTATAIAAPVAGAALGCPPGATADSDAVVHAINKTVDKENKAARKAIDHADLNPGESSTKDHTLSTGVTERTTLTRSADGATYTLESDWAQANSTNFVEVSSGSRTTTKVGDVKTVDETVALSYDLLRTFIPLKLSGSFSANLEVTKDPSKPGQHVKNDRSVSFTDIMVKTNDKHGPRTGSYTQVHEPGVGGDLDYSANIPTPCTSNPSAGPAQVTVQHRHFVDGNVAIARRDTRVTGGTLAAGEKVIHLNCGSSPLPRADNDPSRYHLNKREDASGNTVSGTVKTKNPTDPPCDSRFGLPTPTLANSATDYDFSQPASFPGEW